MNELEKEMQKNISVIADIFERRGGFANRAECEKAAKFWIDAHLERLLHGMKTKGGL